MKLMTTDKKLRHDFFLQNLLDTLNQSILSLRAIKAKYPDVQQIDRKIDSYIDLGLIKRENKRYYLNSELVFASQNGLVEKIVEKELALIKSSMQSIDYLFFSQYFRKLQLDQPKFILLEKFPKLYRLDELKNQTNQVVFYSLNQLTEENLNLFSYFIHQDEESLSKAEQHINQYLGDVNPEYALKYMTTFLLKFLKKEQVTQKRTDIFVRALVDFKVIEQVAQDTYALKLPYVQNDIFDLPILDQLQAIELESTVNQNQLERFITIGIVHQKVYDYFMSELFAYWTIRA